MDGEIVRLEESLLAGDEVGLARGALIASGVATVRELNSCLARIDGLYGSIAEDIDSQNNDLDRARVIFDWLWGGRLDRYEPRGSFRLNEVVDAQAGGRRRVGNCMGLTILYNVLAHDFGLDATAVHLEQAFGRGPHVFTVLDIAGRAIDIENILPDGFDYRGNRRVVDREPWGNRELIADLYHSVGNEYFELGQSEYAVTSYEKALRLHSGYVRVHLNRGMALVELGRFAEAEDDFRQAARQ